MRGSFSRGDQENSLAEGGSSSQAGPWEPAFLVALTFAMLADELAKSLILGKDGT
jgi:hypothetical protein